MFFIKRIEMKTYKIESSEELNIKRMYLPLEINQIYPNCQEKILIDFSQDYLS